jgi:hypothetical protein
VRLLRRQEKFTGEGRLGRPPGKLAAVELQQIRWQERRRTKRTLRFEGRLLENALRSARMNLITPSRAGKDADHKSSSPRYRLDYF